MGSVVVGREAELAALGALLAHAQERPAAVVVAGEAGLGKSTLWHATVDEARRQGWATLTARPGEAERDLPLAALGDLLGDVVDAVLPTLSPPRRRALESALLLKEPHSGPAERRALGVAVHDALTDVAHDGPLLIAIDDIQWLDTSSAGVLAFALRRLAWPGVAVMLTERVGEPCAHRALTDAIGHLGAQQVVLGPLGADAIHRFLRDRLDVAVPRQTLLRIHEQSGGNPLLALELARAARDLGPAAAVVPPSMEEVVRARLGSLSADTRRALGTLAAMGGATEPQLRATGSDPAHLDSAVRAQVVTLEADGFYAFAHPVLAAAAYRDLGSERAAVHAHLAAVTGDVVRRAQHLARSTSAPDSGVAAELERAAELALRRGASAEAAELGEHAMRLTPTSAPGLRMHRALAAARAHQAAGEWTRADRLAAGVLGQAVDPIQRVDARVLLAELGSADRAVTMLEAALQEEGLPVVRQADLHGRLAWATRFRKGYAEALSHAATADDLANDLEPEAKRRATLVHTILGWMVGRSGPPELAGVHDLASALGGERLVQEAVLAIVNSAVGDQREEVRAFLEREMAGWDERDEPLGASARWGLAWLEFWSGRWAVAAEHAHRAHDVSSQYGLVVPQDHLPIAVVAVHCGQLDVARHHSTVALELAEQQLGLHPPQHLAVLALVALGEGDRDGAARGLSEAHHRARELGWREPTLRWWAPAHVELLLELGRLDEAAVILDGWAGDAAQVGRAWALAHVHRCRGLALAAAGDAEAAVATLEQAVDAHEAVGDPFGRGQARLALGVARRRLRAKRPARDAIEAARADFVAVGAAGWAIRADAELGRIGGRTRQDALTTAERRVAVLVAEGRTNKEVAAELYLGERTVASHLTRVYAKLGVRSRTELARAMQRSGPM